MSVAQSFFSLHLFNFCVVSNTAQTCHREHFVCQLRGSPPSILSPKFHLHYGFYYTVTMTSRHNNSCVTLLPSALLLTWVLCCCCAFDSSMFLSRIIIIPCVRLMLLYGRQPASHFWSDYQQKNSTDPDYAAWCRHRCRKLNWKKYHTTLSFPLFQLELLSLARFSHKFHRNGTEHHLLTRPNFFLILFFTTLF